MNNNNNNHNHNNNNNNNSNNTNCNNLYQLELQKMDLMIGIWQEITRFSNRVLNLHINHRETVCRQMNQTEETNINRPRSIRNGHHNHRHHSNNNINNKSHHKRKQYRFSTGNDTSSDSESNSDSDINHDKNDDISSDSEYHPRSKSSSNNNNNNNNKNTNNSSTKKERKTTKGRRSGYNIYFGVRCKEIQKSDPNLEFATISRNIGNEWKNLNKTQQQKWNEAAAKMTKQKQEEQARKERIEKEKKRKLSEINGGGNIINMNSMVSNVRIEDTNKLKLNNTNIIEPPRKKMRIGSSGHIKNINNNNNNLPILNNNNLAMFNGSQMPDMSAPALSLLSEALKNMPALQVERK